MKISEAKAAFRQIADRYYRDPLEKAGFVSYKNEGLCWYQIRNDESAVLMDEALYFREESVYPAVLVNLRQKENDLLEWNWTLAQEQERAAKLSEVQCRIRAAEFGDFDELQQRFQQREQALMREISQKLPNIQIITDEAALRNAERFPKWISPFPPNMI